MTLYLAPHGWDHPGWAGEFYPDDLPPAWRLAYFFHAFDTVVVPAGVWQGAPDATGWCEDSPSTARFFLELPGSLDAAERLLAAAPVLGSRLVGLVATPAQSPQDLAWWRARLPLPVAGGDMGLATWQGPATDLRALRERMSTLARRGPALLLFQGEPPDLDALRAARTLAQLLGLPS
jgi:hypothetical protein